MSRAGTNLERALGIALERGEIGLQVAAYSGQTLVADAWAGLADVEAARPVTGDTLFVGFAHAKVLTSLALHLQVERGLLHLDNPVADYWPEFAARGKQDITIAQVLAHECGLPQMPAGVTPELQGDWEWMVAGLAGAEPCHPPGTASAYMIINQGWILGEVVRRTDPAHRPFGQFVREEVCEPIGAAEAWLGIPAGEEPRVARTYLPVTPSAAPASGSPPPLAHLAMPAAVAVGPAVYNLPLTHQACNPGTGALGTARSWARVMALIANLGELDGVRLLSEETTRTFTRRRANRYEVDLCLGYVPPVGTAGIWVGGTPQTGLSPSIAFMGGVGGLVWADLERRVGGAILHNHVYHAGAPPDPHPLDPVGRAIDDLTRALTRQAT